MLFREFFSDLVTLFFRGTAKKRTHQIGIPSGVELKEML